MPALNIALVLVAIGASIAYLVTVALAYGRRRDRGFAGGASILTGWWLLSPYDGDGVSESEVSLVRAGRVSWVTAAGAFVALWWLGGLAT